MLRPPTIFIAGATIGVAGATLLWQAPLERRLSMVKKAQHQTEQALAIADDNLQSLKKCTTALNDLVDTVRRK